MVLAIPFSGRDREPLENVVGYLMLAMYIRIDVNNTGNFSELVSCVLNKYSKGLAHVNYSRRSLRTDIDKNCAVFLNNTSVINNDRAFDLSKLQRGCTDEELYYPLRVDVSCFTNGWLISCRYRKTLFAKANALPLMNVLKNMLWECGKKP